MREENSCCTRQCCGPNRPFNFHVTDHAGMEVLELTLLYHSTPPCHTTPGAPLQEGLCVRPLWVAKLLLLPLPVYVGIASTVSMTNFPLKTNQ